MSLDENVVNYCGWVGNNNIGDEAVYVATKQLLNEFELSTEHYEDPAATVVGGGTVLPLAVRSGSVYDIPRTGQVHCLGVGVLSPEFHNRRLRRTDLRALLGERGISVRKLGSVGKVARLLNGAIGCPFNLDDWYLFEEDFERVKEFGFDRLGVRGPLSREILTEYDIDATVVGDPALYLRPDVYYPETNERIGICVRDPRPQAKRNTKWTEDLDYIDTLVEFCNDRINTNVIVYPFHTRDLQLSEELASRIKRATLADYCSTVNIDGLLNDISRCDVMIGEKLHASVLSASCHVPFVSLEYKPKNTDFARSVGTEQNNIRIDDLTLDRLEVAFSRAKDDSFREDLVDQVDASRNRLEEFAQQIKADIVNDDSIAIADGP